VRDKVSGLVTGVINLAPSTDYDVDYLQGTVLLAKPLAATVSDSLLVRTGSDSGDEAYLVVRYEYTPGFDEVDALSVGGQMHYWLTDRFKVGMMASENSNDDSQFESSLKAGDVTYRLSAESWVKVQGGWSEGLQAQSLSSADGGYEFLGENDPLVMDSRAAAYRGDTRARFSTYSSEVPAGVENMRSRARYYGENNAYFGRAIAALATNLVGAGIVPASQHPNAAAI